MHVGDSDAGREAVPGREEQRRHREDRERGAAGVAARLPAAAVLVDVAVLVLRAEQAAQLPGDPGGSERDTARGEERGAGDDAPGEPSGRGDVVERRRAEPEQLAAAAETVEVISDGTETNRNVLCIFFRYPAGQSDVPGTQVASIGPQTYIVAQNPEVLAHLMKENENRGICPSVYTTPASVFNTIAVDFDDKEAVTNTENPSLKTCPIPITSLRELDPPPSSSPPTVPDDPTPEPPYAPAVVAENVAPHVPVPIAVPDLVRSQPAPVVEGIYDFGGADVKSCAYLKGNNPHNLIQCSITTIVEQSATATISTVTAADAAAAQQIKVRAWFCGCPKTNACLFFIFFVQNTHAF